MLPPLKVVETVIPKQSWNLLSENHNILEETPIAQFTKTTLFILLYFELN